MFLPSEISPPTEHGAVLVNPKCSELKFGDICFTFVSPQICNTVITLGGCKSSGVEVNTLRVLSDMATVKTGVAQ